MLYAFSIAALLGAEPDFDVTLKRGDDRVEVCAKPGRVVFTVVSPRGIGTATIARREPQWPKAVILQLRLRGLESLTTVAGQVALEASVSSTPPHTVRLSASAAGKQKEEAVDCSSHYWTEVRMLNADGKPASGLPAEGGWFELQLPAALLAGDPESVEVRWIDFYRN
jgi:hypothetical protein